MAGEAVAKERIIGLRGAGRSCLLHPNRPILGADPGELNAPHWVGDRGAKEDTAGVSLAADIIEDAALSDTEPDPLDPIEDLYTPLCRLCAAGVDLVTDPMTGGAAPLEERRAEEVGAAVPVIRVAVPTDTALSFPSLVEAWVTWEAGADRLLTIAINERAEGLLITAALLIERAERDC